MKVVCINNTPKIYPDGSTDDADQYLTINKVYDAKIEEISGNLYIEVSDKGGFPNGHRWWRIERFISLYEHRSNKINDIGF